MTSLLSGTSTATRPPGFFGRNARKPGAAAAALVFTAAVALGAPAAIPLEIPQALDDRLQVTLYADSAEIVTPIGAAVDAKGRLFVLESHTHLAPPNYAGPKRDLIKIFEGSRPDGRAARVSVFANDVLEGMNLAFAPDGTLHVITAKTVAALRDRDGDGRADETQVLLRLETDEKYPHNQLLGITISADGWIYAARGNTGGQRHAWVGADGARLEAYGNGGDIVRVRLDGSKLERIAEGFWNPFDLKFDRFGRLLCVDNDPDSRGPNRLLHIVAGGDYGFKSLYGPSGLHPYNAWDGELPGTLPMIAGIGESPSGVIDLTYAALPSDYRDTIAATIWAEHHVSLVRPKRTGVSLRGTAQPWLKGGKWFRPVAIVSGGGGAVYITDWVLKDYPNHGFGRIWKLTTKPGVATMRPPPPFGPAEPDPGPARLERLARAGTRDLPELRRALKDSDPFVRHAGVLGLSQPELRELARHELASDDAALRLGALLALRRAGVSDVAALVRPRLQDADEQVCRMALIWAGEKELRELLPEIDAVGSRGDLTPRLFETWLATMQILQTPPLAAGGKPPRAFSIKRELNPALLERMIGDPKRSAAVRSFALRRLEGTNNPVPRARLIELARSGVPALRVEAIRMLARLNEPAALDVFREIVGQRQQPSTVRAEAVLALGPGAADALRPLLQDPDAIVRTQAARTLRMAEDAATASRPAAPDADGWVRALARGGDPAAGERVFFAMTSTCAQCHRVNGRGGTLGPDLSLIARTATREQIIRSIVSPSEDVAPQFQGWEAKLKNGEVITGLQGHWRTGGGATMILLDGKERRFTDKELADFGAMTQSLMPEGLAALFSVSELLDLVAFLEQCR